MHAVAPRLRAAGGGASRTRPDAARRRAGGSGARGTMREERCPRAALTARHGPKPAVRVETHLLESWDHQSRRRTVETDRPNTPGFGEAEPCRLALLTERELSAETPRPGTRDRWHEPHNDKHQRSAVRRFRWMPLLGSGWPAQVQGPDGCMIGEDELSMVHRPQQLFDLFAVRTVV